MPEEKQAKLDFMMRTIPTDGTTAYIGDGVSDIEQLKMADVGVVMGTRGSRYSADAANVLIKLFRSARVHTEWQCRI